MGMSSENIILRPQPGPQTAFAAADTTIAFYGGAAGSGKSFVLLLDILRHVNDKDFRGVIFRRTQSDLRKPGGLWDEAKQMWRHFGCIFKEATLTAIFASGASIKFSHMEKEDDKYSWQGSQLTYVGFDEAAHFSESQVLYLMSRMRSRSKTKPCMRLTLNPDSKEHWIYKFFKPYLDMSTGIPKKALTGKVHWFVNIEGEVAIEDTQEKLYGRFGTSIRPMSYTVIPGNIYDNRELLRVNPDYLANLEALPRVERERLLLGSWHAEVEGAGYFSRSDVEIISPMKLPRMIKKIRAWDLAVTEPSEANPNPDYTAGVLMGLGEDGYYYVIDVVHFRGSPAKVAETIIKTAEGDGKNTTVGLPLEPGSAGKISFQNWARPLTMLGYRVKKLATRKSKLERFQGFSNTSENGLVRVVKASWNDAMFYELENFSPENERRFKNDILDATSDSFNYLVSGNANKTIKNFSPSSLTKPNAFSSIL